MAISLDYNNFFSWIEKKTAKKYYPFLLTLLLVIISLLLAFPRYDLYYNTSSIWDVTMVKAHDLTNDLSYITPDSFLAKKVFRLTIPVVIKLLHLSRMGVLIVQFILGFLFILYSYKLALKLLKDPVSATFLAAGVAFIYCGRTCFTEVSYTWFDGWAYFFILMTLYNRNILSIFLFTTLAAWTDERAFVALPLAILFHQANKEGPDKLKFKSLIALNSATIAVIMGMIGYIALRLFLTSAYDMHTPKADANFNVLARNVTHTSFGFGTYTFLEGFWMLLPLVVYFAVRNKHYILLSLVFLQMAISSLAALSVYDITRSGSYLSSVIFIFIVYLSNYIERKNFRTILAICFFFSFIFPPVNYIAFADGGFEFQIEKPFFWVLYNLIH